MNCSYQLLGSKKKIFWIRREGKAKASTHEGIENIPVQDLRSSARRKSKENKRMLLKT
jgi:hypothetical protein